MFGRVLLLSLPVGLLALIVGRYYLQDVKEQTKYRFGSFAPIRDEKGTRAKWYVDGEDYMSAVADAILAAEHEILITDWQMNPFIFLKRPEDGVTSLEWRLDKLLLKKAEETDFRIVILLYWETKPFLNLGNELVQDILNHTNIEVLYHPTWSTPIEHMEVPDRDDPTKLPLRWSHHEKIILIDRSIAFVGGIDLAYGRWDTPSHSLSDDHPHHPCVLEELAKCNAESARNEADSSKRYCRWTGKDYGNTFLGGGRSGFDKPLEDYIDRHTTPRMPWHDVACSFDGPAASDIAKHFIQRYRAIKQDWWWKLRKLWKSRERGYIDDVVDWAGHSTQVNTAHTASNPSNVKIQVLRSVDEWSANLPHEDSILKAYIHAIENAEHSIYIENQFFISSQSYDTIRKAKNEIQSALANRIIRAYENSKDFRVMIILPLQPEFPGEWGTGGDLDSVSYWNYASLYTGENSLMHKLKENMPAIKIPLYFNVYGLRTHEIWPDDIFITEIIYVHSKLMIVDDRISIIGSANINDRSMLGSRDSEVNVIIEDKEMVDGTMNGAPYPVGKFSHDLRCRLVKEHLGLLENEPSDVDIDVRDPVAYKFYAKLYEIAESNTEIYEYVFHRKILPTDYVADLEQLKNWTATEGLADESPKEAKEELEKIRGRLVKFPSLFLRDILKPSVIDFLLMFVDRHMLEGDTGTAIV